MTTDENSSVNRRDFLQKVTKALIGGGLLVGGLGVPMRAMAACARCDHIQNTCPKEDYCDITPVPPTIALTAIGAPLVTRARLTPATTIPARTPTPVVSPIRVLATVVPVRILAATLTTVLTLMSVSPTTTVESTPARAMIRVRDLRTTAPVPTPVIAWMTVCLTTGA